MIIFSSSLILQARDVVIDWSQTTNLFSLSLHLIFWLCFMIECTHICGICQWWCYSCKYWYTLYAENIQQQRQRSKRRRRRRKETLWKRWESKLLCHYWHHLKRKTLKSKYLSKHKYMTNITYANIALQCEFKCCKWEREKKNLSECESGKSGKSSNNNRNCDYKESSSSLPLTQPFKVINSIFNALLLLLLTMLLNEPRCNNRIILLIIIK